MELKERWVQWERKGNEVRGETQELWGRLVLLERGVLQGTVASQVVMGYLDLRVLKVSVAFQALQGLKVLVGILVVLEKQAFQERGV